MPISSNIHEFLSTGAEACIIDVRTPKEFLQGHIPGAVNIPLFTNEERAIVGTIYKKEGRQPAILKGLELVGPRMAEIIHKVQAIAKGNTVCVHCWRGGMRSGSVGWLLEMFGFKVYTLRGGYKAFRKEVLSGFKIETQVLILSGKTGTGKTHILHQLQKIGAQVIDLERLANHKGSAFGALGEEAQPTQEQFENELYLNILKINTTSPVWIEDESRLIGTKVVPDELWRTMRNSIVVYVEVPFEDRVNNLIQDYGKFTHDELRDSILKISRRLGPEQTKFAIDALDNSDLKTVCELCLDYYDKTYSHGLKKRENLRIETYVYENMNFELIAKHLHETALYDRD